MSGRTAIAVPVPEAEPLVSHWRARYDASAAQGMPAHITILYPFLAEDRLTDDVLGGLREICSEVPVLDIAFRRVGRFPDVVYLAPEPSAELRNLTLAIVERWPDVPPYGGAFDDVVSHLTVAHHAGEDAAAEIEAELRGRLPIRARLAWASLFIHDGQGWRLRHRLPFAPHRSAG
jgi:2'-5' RNA ligase